MREKEKSEKNMKILMMNKSLMLWEALIILSWILQISANIL